MTIYDKHGSRLGELARSGADSRTYCISLQRMKHWFSPMRERGRFGRLLEAKGVEPLKGFERMRR